MTEVPGWARSLLTPPWRLGPAETASLASGILDHVAARPKDNVLVGLGDRDAVNFANGNHHGTGDRRDECSLVSGSDSVQRFGIALVNVGKTAAVEACPGHGPMEVVVRPANPIARRARRGSDHLGRDGGRGGLGGSGRAALLLDDDNENDLMRRGGGSGSGRGDRGLSVGRPDDGSPDQKGDDSGQSDESENFDCSGHLSPFETKLVQPLWGRTCEHIVFTTLVIPFWIQINDQLRIS